MPQALRDSLAAAGVTITDDIAEAAAVLVGGYGCRKLGRGR